jgi:hypothetical protein
MRNLAIGLVCTLIGIPVVFHSPRAAEGTDGGSSCTAVACFGDESCSTIPGSGSIGCTIDSSGCWEHLGVCIRTVAQLTEDFGVKAELVEVDEVHLLHIGDQRYAAWNCDGDLIKVMARLPGGGLVDIDPTPFIEAYHLEVLRGARSLSDV